MRNIVHNTDPNSFAVAGNRPGVDSKLGEADSRPVPLGSNTRKDKVDSRDLMPHQVHSKRKRAKADADRGAGVDPGLG